MFTPSRRGRGGGGKGLILLREGLFACRRGRIGSARERFEDGVRDLGGVEETRGVLGFDGADESALGDAGDEVADIVIPDERGHGVVPGFSGIGGALELAFAGFVAGAEDAGIGMEAGGYGGVGVGGAGGVGRQHPGDGLHGEEELIEGGR